MPDRLSLAAIVVLGVPLALVAYITLVEWLLSLLPDRRRSALRPWLWLTPALAFLGIFLLYPALNTVSLSLHGPNSEQFVGLANFQYVFTDASMLMALRNNFIWLLFFTLLTVSLGLLIAVLTDRVPYESAAKALIFLPLAISFVAAGVIWKFMYDF